jgi:hypothetical protein
VFEGPRPTALVRAEHRIKMIIENNASTTRHTPFQHKPLTCSAGNISTSKNDSEPRQSRRPPTLDPGEDLTSGELAITF